MLDMWRSIEDAIRASPSFAVTVVALTVLFFIFLLVADGFRRGRSRRRKKIKQKIPFALSNPLELQHRK